MKPHGPTKWGSSYRNWYIPLKEDRIRLCDAVWDIHAMTLKNNHLPLLFQFCEEGWLNQSLTLLDHDCLHILLGRGLMPKDEAFVAGFTIGSTNFFLGREYQLDSLLVPYLGNPDDREVFHDGFLLGMSSYCKALDKIDFRRYMNEQLGSIRRKLGINANILSAYYESEAERFSYARESRRLIH